MDRSERPLSPISGKPNIGGRSALPGAPSSPLRGREKGGVSGAAPHGAGRFMSARPKSSIRACAVFPRQFFARLEVNYPALADGFLLVRGLVVARIRAAKSSARGLRVLAFNLMIPIGRRLPGSSRGRALRDDCLSGRRNEKLGSAERKRPVASNLLRILSDWVKTVARGGSTPLARKPAAISAPASVLNGRSTHGSLTNSAS